MIDNDEELNAALERIAHFHKQVMALRDVCTSRENYQAAAEGFLLEMDQLFWAVRTYMSTPPARFRSDKTATFDDVLASLPPKKAPPHPVTVEMMGFSHRAPH